MIHTTLSQWSQVYDRAKHLTTKPFVISEEKHLSSLLVSNGFLSPFIQKFAKTTRVTANKEPAQEFKPTAILPYIKDVSDVLRRSLQHRGIRTLFKSDTTFRSRLNALEPTKQNGIVYKIPCECGRVHISETARSMRERIKEHDRDIRFARTQTSAVLEHANETGHIPIWCKAKFIGRDPYWYTSRVKEAIYIWLHPNNFNGNSGIEIPKA